MRCSLEPEVHLAGLKRDATVGGVDEQGAGFIDTGGDTTRTPYPADGPALERVSSAPRGQHILRLEPVIEPSE